ncbi:uncharacterized protein [Antennarius striatus]|uniref:uncharacterized protein n=1 Tax=Antennarius striatus TaxID=241820 RepID=UPI0035B37B29
MCPLPDGCKTPTHITVTSAAHNSKDKSDKQFYEVKNLEPKQDSFTYNFTVCFSTMFDFINVLQLVQSLEMLKLLGVNKVAIYKTNCSSETQRILDYYTKQGFVEVIPWSVSKYLKVSRSWLPQYSPGDIHYFGQIPALNDCLYRYMYETKYLAQHDIDELILPQSVDNWLELLPLLERKYGADLTYMFENNVFPNTVDLPPPGSPTLPPLSSCCPEWQNITGVNILAHLYHEPITSENAFGGFKIIFNPRTVSSTSVHGVQNSNTGITWVERHIALLHHTREARDPDMKPGQLVYNGRLLSYSTQLTSAVRTVFMDSGLLQVDTL